MKYYLSFIAVLFASFVSAQEDPVGVEPTSGIQTGLIGFWGYHEFRLSQEIALRAEAGFDLGIAIGPFEEDTYGLIPILRLEPRWYYNLPKRSSKGYSTQDNAGNFVGLNTAYIPDVFIGSNPNDLHVLYKILVIPKWGIRRNLGQHFNYEAGIGVGYVRFREEYLGEMNGIYPDLHLRIGYKF